MNKVKDLYDPATTIRAQANVVAAAIEAVAERIEWEEMEPLIPDESTLNQPQQPTQGETE